MIKKLLLYSFSIVLATYFSFAGLGFNLINYCCSECAEAGIEKVALLSCEKIHHLNGHSDGECTCGHSSEAEKTAHSGENRLTHSHDDACGLTRINTDTPQLTEFEENLVFLPLIASLSYDVDLFNAEYLLSLKNSGTIMRRQTELFVDSGRSILSMCAVLRI